MQLKAHRMAPLVDGLEIVPAHPQREWMNQTNMPNVPLGQESENKGYANRCLPLLMANQLGWDIKSKCHAVVTMLHDGTHITHWPNGPVQVGGPMQNFGDFMVTWSLPWIFESEPGWDLLFIAPPNEVMPKGVTVLSGLVETDHGITKFTANWKIEPGLTVFIKPGDVITRMIPIQTAHLEGLELVEDDEVPSEYGLWQQARSKSTRLMNMDPKHWDKGYWDKAKRRKLRRGKPELPTAEGVCPVNQGGH